MADPKIPGDTLVDPETGDVYELVREVPKPRRKPEVTIRQDPSHPWAFVVTTRRKRVR